MQPLILESHRNQSKNSIDTIIHNRIIEGTKNIIADPANPLSVNAFVIDNPLEAVRALNVLENVPTAKDFFSIVQKEEKV